LNHKSHSDSPQSKNENDFVQEGSSEKEINTKALQSAMEDETDPSFRRFDSAPFQSRLMN